MRWDYDVGKDRERQAIAQVECPECGAPIGQPCAVAGGRPVVCPERRKAWQAARPTDPVESADIIMSDHVEGPPGARTWQGLILAPLTDRGRAALPDGLTRVEQREVRATLSRLRDQGLIVMRES